MNLYVSFDGDHVGRQVGRMAQEDDEEGVRRVSRAIEAGNRYWEGWVLERLGEVISSGGDEGRLKVPAESVGELPAVRAKYESAVGATVSVGVGTRMREADRALLVAKLRGGDRIVLYTPEVEGELAEVTPQTEREKLSDEYLTKFEQAAFRSVVTGEVRGTGAVHDAYWGESDGWEPGFLTRGGAFVLSTSLVKAEPPKPVTLAPENSPAGGGGFKGRTEPGQAAGAESPVAEASEHSEGEAAQSAAEGMASPETTRGAEDFERELHDHAQRGEREDSQSEQEDDLTRTKRRVVELLTQVKQQAPAMEQIRQQAPEVYEAVKAAVESVVLVARALQAQPGAQQEEQPAQKAEEPLEKRVEVRLPVGASRDGKVKVHHGDTDEDGWVSVRAGQVLSNDGHAVSSRNPGGR